MTIIVAVTDSREGQLALVEAIAEAKHFDTALIAVNLAATTLDLSPYDTQGVAVTVVDRRAHDKENSAQVVLDEVEQHHATRLVIGVQRRTPVGKALLGSMSQRLLLDCPVPVLAVKLPEDQLTGGAFSLPTSMVRVTG